MSLKEMLKGKISDEEMKLVRKSFEIIGDIVIIEIPEEIIHLKNLIVNAILKKHKHVKTILRKVGEVNGVFRVAKYEIIYGSETETIAKEFGCKFLVDPTKVYYTVKLSGERERIAKQVREGEKVLVMFAGVGPYAIVIAKLAKPKVVVGIEINPKAVEYFRKNVKLNKVDNVVIYEGDVKEILPKINEEFDRILMPAPHSAENFVYLIKNKIKVGGIVHYYTFASQNEEKVLPEKIKEIFEKSGMVVEILNIKECGSFAPYVNRYVADVKIIKIID
ncbi:MAG: class I SAM-dependent methyltransferase family protein [Archaeoglobaceae archaeon]|nr:class I SAM-dependent methyltransferase family protein [Archaeoglobaceae archaeon]